MSSMKNTGNIKDVEKKVPLYTVVGNVNWCSHCGKQFLKTLKTELPWFSNSTPGYISKENENANLKRYMHPNVQSSTIYNSQDMEAT